jgi:Mg-chelatase subunit ChlD
MKVIKAKDKTTYVVFVLDGSVSMQRVRAETISGFNEQLLAIKEMEKPDHEVLVSVIVFSEPNMIHTQRKWVKASQIENLTEADYSTSGGSTALLDGMFDAINLIKDKDEEIKKGKNAGLVLFVTDGQENSSVRATASKIKEEITALRATCKYTFTFMGCLEGSVVEREYGIAAGSTTNFAFGAAGALENSATNTNAIRHYTSLRDEGHTFTQDFYDSVNNGNTNNNK